MLNAKQEKEFQEMVMENVDLAEQEKIAKAFIEAEDVAGQPEPREEELTHKEHIDNKKEPHYEYINKPSHYNFFNMQAIDVIEKTLTWEEFIGFLKGTALRYKIRAGSKPNENSDKDLKKSKWYENYYNNMIMQNTIRMK